MEPVAVPFDYSQCLCLDKLVFQRQDIAQRGEMKKVAWPPREEIFNSTIVVVIGLVVMTAIIFGFDWVSAHIVEYVFK